MSIFRKSDDTGAEAQTPNSNLPSSSTKQQEERDSKAEKAVKEAMAKTAKNPVDAHGNPMPDLNALAQAQVKAGK